MEPSDQAGAVAASNSDQATAPGSTTPFRDQGELIEAELALTRARIRFARADRDRRASSDAVRLAWPDEFAHADQLIAERVALTLAEGTELPIVWLEDRLGLGLGELRILWVLLAHELDASSRAMLREINTESCADPTTDTVRAVAFGPAHRAEASRLLATTSPLVLGGLVERTDTEATAPDHRKTWKVARRIAAIAQGDLSTDPELFRIATVVPPDAGSLGIAGLGIEADPDCLPVLVTALRNGLYDDRTVVVQGQRGTGRRTLLRAAAAARNLELLEIDVERLAGAPALLQAQLNAIARDCRLFQRVPLLRNLDALAVSPVTGDPSAPSVQADRLDQVIAAFEGRFLLATSSTVIPGNRLRKPQIVEPRPLTGAQLARLWRRALPISDQDADRIATMYPVAPSLIDAAASVALAQTADASRAIDPYHIRIGLRAVLDGQLAGLATRIDTPQTWESLVLPDDQRDAIGELLARVAQRQTVYETWGLGSHVGRGLGVSALFSGPPGTGKTMAAGLIAKKLATDLYQVDMSKIVSKWIGETEKNLARLFDAAEAGHAILLFDEADALFGKRTAVKTSNDRHANQETNYLLQRLEAFRGVCVLTTNHDSAIDEAFRRRLSLHVYFPLPDVHERARLWRTMMRSTVPVAGALDFAGLASKYEMSGGHIRNAVLRAAFFAADARTPVTNQHLSRAAQLEYQAMGRIAPSSL